MGTRKFYEVMIVDALQERSKDKIANRDNVVSLRDFMQVFLEWKILDAFL